MMREKERYTKAEIEEETVREKVVHLQLGELGVGLGSLLRHC